MKVEVTKSGSGVLFIGSTAGRHGTTTQLLHFLRWYKAHGRRPFSLLLGEGGELLDDYTKTVNTRRADLSHWCPGGIRSKTLSRLGLKGMVRKAERDELRKFASSCRPGLIYVNSVATEGVRLIETLDLGIPVVTHSHEMEYCLAKQSGSSLSKLLSVPTKFIACSRAVRSNLIRKHGVASERVETVHEAIPVSQIRATRSRAEILSELGFPNDALLVAACGELCWVKGGDLFVQLARSVCLRHPQACFVWIGGGAELHVKEFNHDVRVAGLDQRIRLTGAVNPSADYIGAADVFALTSREDAFPLVCLEAAALGKPIVCFEDAGGEPEFVEDDCGFVVPFLDVQAMVERVISLLGSSECRQKLGCAAKRKVTERHDIGMAAQQVVEILERTISGA